MRPLCPPLQAILDAELASGNEVTSVAEFVWTQIDYAVSLRRPFKRNYSPEVTGTDVTFYANSDPHYPIEDIYSSPSHRQSVSAPTRPENL